MALSGWELHGRALDLLQSGEVAPIEAFVQQFGPLAAYSPDFHAFAVLRRFHPSLNCAPDDAINSSEDFSIRIGYYTSMMETFFHLPKDLTYLSLRLVRPDAGSLLVPDFLIETAQYGATLTNISELMSTLAPDYKPLAPDEMHAAFAQLVNARPKPVKRIAITSTHIELAAIGALAQSEFEDWWSATVHVPVAEKLLPVTIVDFNPQDPAQDDRLASFNSAVEAFLSLGATERRAAGERAIENKDAFFEAVGDDGFDETMVACRDANTIWAFIYPRTAYVCYGSKTGRAYVSLACDCEWEQEHGLKFVYRDGRELTQVCEQDGVTEE